MIERAPASRQSLLRLRRRLEQVERGIDLLQRKRQALVAELFRGARTVVEARSQLSSELRAAHEALLEVLAVHGAAGLRALGWPHRELELGVEERSVWGVRVAELDSLPSIRRDLAARAISPAGCGAEVIEAGDRFERVLDTLLRSAPQELRLRRLGEELSRTSRQVHGLERRVERSLVRDLARVRQVLDEREREEHARLRHFLRRREAPARPVDDSRDQRGFRGDT